MGKLWRIAEQEYRRNVFRRSFLLALLSVPLMIALNVGLGYFIESRRNNNAPVGYVDHSGLLADPIPAPPGGSGKAVPLVPFQSEGQARAALEAGAIQAYYVLAGDYLTTRQAGLFYLQSPGANATRQFYDFLRVNLLAGQPPGIARRAARIGEQVTVRSLDGRRHVPSGGPSFGTIVPIVVGLAFLLLLLMSSGYLIQAVVNEKENRTMEVLVSSVSPLQLIGGKLLGIVAIGLSQLVVWTAVALLAVAIAGRAGIEWFQEPGLDWGIVLTTVALAVPCYVLACALMVATGATVTSSQESQSIGTLFSILHLLPLWLAWAIVQTPDAPLPTVLSFLPFTALLTVTLRNVFAAVPTWQVAASIAIQAVCAVGAIGLAGRAFRLGMLRYGRRLSLRELVGARSP